ncbi:unnamed protein product [Arabidopsis arenosa]|uniref:Uncharacterized protein n=1 Tax=Arabidopsis arenosa TaxID=38785 RepID=A0A8S1ZSA4_ARAAE|nr:unnamed protein product [Arabidopsis arenosa]
MSCVGRRDYEDWDAAKMKEHECAIAKAEGVKRAVRIEAELMEVSDHGKSPWRRWLVKVGRSFKKSFKEENG